MQTKDAGVQRNLIISRKIEVVTVQVDSVGAKTWCAEKKWGGYFCENAGIVLGGGEIVGPRHWEEQSEDNRINLIN